MYGASMQNGDVQYIQAVTGHRQISEPSFADKKLMTWSTSNIYMQRVSKSHCYGPGDSTAAVGEL